MSTCYGLNCVLPQKRDVGILSLSNPEGNLIGIQGLYKCKQEKMRSLGCDWCQKKGEIWTEGNTHTGKTSCEDEGRNSSDVSKSQRRSKMGSITRSKRPGTELPRSRLEEPTLRTPLSLTSSLQTVRQHMLFKAPSLWYLAYHSPSILIHSSKLSAGNFGRYKISCKVREKNQL